MPIEENGETKVKSYCLNFDVSLCIHFKKNISIRQRSHWEHWRSQPKNFWGGKMFDFRRITLFCFEKRLSKHKMTIFSKNVGGGHGPFGSPWLRL